MLDGLNEQGNFHIKYLEHIEKNAVEQGHFEPLRRRINAIN